MKRSMQTQLDMLKPNLERMMLDQQAHQNLIYDKHARGREFVVGQKVMVQNLLNGPTWVSGVISEQKGPLTYLVEVESNQYWRRHVDQIRDKGDSTLRESIEERKGIGIPDGPFQADLEMDIPDQDTNDPDMNEQYPETVAEHPVVENTELPEKVAEHPVVEDVDEHGNSYLLRNPALESGGVSDDNGDSDNGLTEIRSAVDLIVSSFLAALKAKGMNAASVQDVDETVDYARKYLSLGTESYRRIWYKFHTCPNSNAAIKLWRSRSYLSGSRVNQKERKKNTPQAGCSATTEEDNSSEDTRFALDDWD
ncbi:hypothetical protein EMCRGX_G009519 [Ephydatia muelleri]